jgi:hypothetical protein
VCWLFEMSAAPTWLSERGGLWGVGQTGNEGGGRRTVDLGARATLGDRGQKNAGQLSQAGCAAVADIVFVTNAYLLSLLSTTQQSARASAAQSSRARSCGSAGHAPPQADEVDPGRGQEVDLRRVGYAAHPEHRGVAEGRERASAVCTAEVPISAKSPQSKHRNAPLITPEARLYTWFGR